MGIISFGRAAGARATPARRDTDPNAPAISAQAASKILAALAEASAGAGEGEALAPG